MAPLRLVATMVVLAVVAGCVTIDPAPARPPSPTGPPSTAEAASTPRPTPPTAVRPTPTAPAEPTPTPEPNPLAGPPFSAREPDVLIYDNAEVLSEMTKSSATALLAGLFAEHGEDLVVYTQYKPGSTFDSTRADAIALADEWGVDDGLVIMWNTTRRECQRDVGGNGFVVLYPTPAYAADHLSDAELQDIFDADMLLWLRNCDEDGALMAGLEAIRAGTPFGAIPTLPPNGADTDACTDGAYNLIGWSWAEPYRWQFAESSVPDEYDASAVRDLMEESAANITEARNDCDLPDNVEAEAIYDGTTEAEPCGNFADSNNVIGFGPMPPEAGPLTVALTCPYGQGFDIEADILINEDVAWALSEGECFGFKELLEATLTHEFGHVFGLAHVGERRHGYMTMSPRTNGPCTSEEISLGRGDILGLEQLY